MSHVELSTGSKSVIVEMHPRQCLKMARSCLAVETILASSMFEKYETNVAKQSNRQEVFVVEYESLGF